MLSFTDSQIKETTGQILAAPQKLAIQDTTKQQANDSKAGYKDLDDANKVYTTQDISIISDYHTEYKNLTGTQKTNPSETTIVAGGRLDQGNAYFPDTTNPPVWVNFQPKVAPEVLGNPTSTVTTDEKSIGTRLNSWITLLETGFTSPDGSLTSACEYATATTVTVDFDPGFTVGDSILITDSAAAAFITGTVKTITPSIDPLLPSTLEFTIKNSAGTFSAGTIDNFNTGFSMGQRENGGVAAGMGAYLDFLKSSIDAEVTSWASDLTAEISALADNQAPEPYKTQNITASTNATGTKATLTTWQAKPATGTGVSRYGAPLDATITPLITSRGVQITARKTEIETALGTVTQGADGSYTGSGMYFKFFDNVNIRINKTAGTLRQYYQQSTIGSALDQQSGLTKSTSSRDSQTFLVRTFTADADGTNIIQLNDVGSLTVGESVKIMTNTQQVITTTISSITDLKVQLAASVPATYTKTDQARLVVQLA